MNDSKARRLLARAAAEVDRTTRALLVAAALGETLQTEPTVVGGLAEDLYTDDRYTPTDLDLCGPLSPADRRALGDLGFGRKKGERHWTHPDVNVVVEFPDERIDGDDGRTTRFGVDEGSVKVIGVDDLYLDRLRQATASEPRGGIALRGAVSIAAARYEELDLRYIRARLAAIAQAEPQTGASMAAFDKTARRRARAAITD